MKMPIKVLLPLLLLLTLPAVVQAQFTFTTNNGAITITGYTGPGGAVVIPSATNGLPVTSIGEYAFAYCGLTGVTIPGSVIGIGAYAFEQCTSLPNLTIPNSVTNVGAFAFYGCTSLTRITIGNSVINIGDDAFADCIGLPNVTIPNSVTNIGVYAFSGCENLMLLTVGTSNSAYCSVNGVLFNKSQTTLIQYPGGKAGSYTVPSSVTSLGEGSFEACYRLTSVTVPNGVTSIGGSAFSFCTSLNKVTIPDSVTSLGDGAFANCTSLTRVTIGNNVTSIGNGTFYSCTSLTNLTIPNNVTGIMDWAFAWCTSLTGVTVGKRVTSIGDYAFSSCTGLTGVYFQGNAPILGGGNAFSFGANPTVYYLPGTTNWETTFGGRPTAQWLLPNPLILNSPSFGIRTNQFGFIISWATNTSVVVEASTNLASASWTSLQTCTLTNGSSYFSDPQWMNYPGSFYRLRSP